MEQSPNYETVYIKRNPGRLHRITQHKTDTCRTLIKNHRIGKARPVKPISTLIASIRQLPKCKRCFNE